MKIGLLTFHTAINIGAQLQAFALYVTLKSCGHDVKFVKYEPKYLTKPYRYFRNVYGAQNEAYMSRSAEKWVRGLCFNELGVCG